MQETRSHYFVWTANRGHSQCCEIADAFNDLRWSTGYLRLAFIQAHDLLTEEQMARFSAERHVRSFVYSGAVSETGPALIDAPAVPPTFRRWRRQFPAIFPPPARVGRESHVARN